MNLLSRKEQKKKKGCIYLQSSVGGTKKIVEGWLQGTTERKKSEKKRPFIEKIKFCAKIKKYQRDKGGKSNFFSKNSTTHSK